MQLSIGKWAPPGGVKDVFLSASKPDRRATERERERERERETVRETGRERIRETEREIVRKRDTGRDGERERDSDSATGRVFTEQHQSAPTL